MFLGPQGILNIMNSMTGLPALSKAWSPGEKVAVFFPVVKDPNGNPYIPIGYSYGHSINLGDNFKRSFVPSDVEIDPITHKPLGDSFLVKMSAIASALNRCHKQFELDRNNDLPEDQRKIQNDSVEEKFTKIYPTIGRLTVKAYTEVVACIVDVNNKKVKELGYYSYGVSKSKINQIVTAMKDPKAFNAEDGYLVMTLSTKTDPDKKIAGQVDLQVVTDADRKLEKNNPGIREEVLKLIETYAPTEETISAKVYDFGPYDERELKAAFAQYVNSRKFYLYRNDENGNPVLRDEVINKHVADAFLALDMVSDAEQINALLSDDETEVTTPTTEAQTISLDEIETDLGA